jgi:hypothetical protein
MRFIWRLPQIPIAFLGLGMLAMCFDNAVSGERLDWGALGFGAFLVVAAAAIEFRISELASLQRGGVAAAPGQPVVARRRPLMLLLQGVGVMFVFLLGAASLHKGHAVSAVLWFIVWTVLAAMLGQAIRERRTVRLRIDEEGLDTDDFGRIPWAAVRTVQLRTVSSRYYSAKLLELRLDDAKRYLRRLSGIKGWLARLRAGNNHSTVAVSLSGLDLPPQQVYEAIRTRHQAYRHRHNLPPETGDEAMDAQLAAIHGIMNDLARAQQPDQVLALTRRLKSADAALRSTLDAHHRKLRKSVRQHLLFLVVALAVLAVLFASSLLSRT